MEQLLGPATGWAAAAAVALLAGGAWLRRRRTGTAATAGELDALTRLPSLAMFEQQLADAAAASDGGHRPLALLVVDLDNFRIVNDAYGHALGDRLLAAVPQRLRDALPDALALTRVAGDEFALLLWADREAAHQAAARLRAELRRPQRFDGDEVSLDASVGIALYPEHGVSRRLLSQASTAMRSVKRAGGGTHADYEPAMAVDMRQRAELLRDLRRAVASGDLRLVYQPKIDARSLQVTAAEALLRWEHPQRGWISPTVFVPLAERHGLIAELGRWVVEEAARQAEAWRDQGLRMRVAVNLSAAQMRQDDLVEHLCSCLRRHGIAPHHFTVEITESVAMEDTQVTRAMFERLRQAGVHVSIDDFGTGYSSLASLRKLPAAELKIDRAFITDLETSADARSIATAVLQLAHRLQMRVVAEGVETEAQRDWLVAAGCDELQGYLFARPMPPQVLAVWAAGEQGSAPLAFRESLFRDTAAVPVAAE